MSWKVKLMIGNMLRNRKVPYPPQQKRTRSLRTILTPLLDDNAKLFCLIGNGQ